MTTSSPSALPVVVAPLLPWYRWRRKEPTIPLQDALQDEVVGNNGEGDPVEFSTRLPPFINNAITWHCATPFLHRPISSLRRPRLAGARQLILFIHRALRLPQVRGSLCGMKGRDPDGKWGGPS